MQKAMREDIEYTTLDGRGKTESFRADVLAALEKLGPQSGLHIIKEFEPVPLYVIAEKKGLEKHI